MKLVQKILSHGMLIAFFVAIFFLYLYRVDLFPQWFGPEAESVAQKAPPELDIPPAVKTAPAVSKIDTTPPPAEAVELPPMAEQVPASAPPVEKTPAVPVVTAPETMAAAEATSTAQAAPAPVVPPASAAAPAPEQQAQIPQVQSAESAAQPEYEKQLAAARELFWRRNVRGAVQAYQSLTKSHPDRADAWGELGNLYFSMGRWSQAAEAYDQALGLLIDQGESARARNMLQVMHSLDSGKASELEARLKQAGG